MGDDAVGRVWEALGRAGREAQLSPVVLLNSERWSAGRSGIKS
jgi:hypothetical protein